MQAYLTLETGEAEPATCALTAGQRVTLGRSRTNTVVIYDKYASRTQAELIWTDGEWLLHPANRTTNGIRIDGELVQRPMPLRHGQKISVGDTLLRFSCLTEAGNHDPIPVIARPPVPPRQETDSETLVPTTLQQDELTALCRFMAATVEEASKPKLIRRALTVIQEQTAATIVGFLSLDEEDPLPRVVLPELAQVDFQLSRQLTQRVQREMRSAWLGSHDGATLESDSLLSFKDAVCVPLHAGQAPVGALHVYKSGRMFTEREVRFCEVLAGYLANRLKVLRSQRTLEAENTRLRGHAADEEQLIGSSAVMQKVRDHVERFAPLKSTVLILGESGVGKELVALALHRQSSRHDGPLVPVNCAAISKELAESELFGHQKGAFTGSDHNRPGYFLEADEGTLFLDEIGELSLECQAKLLRVLEGKGFRPVGASADVHVDVRVVAATHRDLESLVRENRFRQDLVYRLGCQIKVPALREHAEDIPELVEYFLLKLSQDYRREVRLTPQALARLQAFNWPGNVRQLRIALENSVAMTDSTLLDAGDLMLPEERVSSSNLPGLNLEQMEAWTIRQALTQSRCNLTQAAKTLGIHVDTLRTKMRKYGIDKCA